MKIISALLFILALNFFLFMTQTGIDKVSEAEGVSASNFFNYDGSMISDFDSGNYTLEEDVSGDLPSGTGQIEPESGNFFTDTFATMKNWLLETTGLKYLLGIVNAFPNFLKQIGLPPELSFGLGFLWHALTLFLAVAWIKN